MELIDYKYSYEYPALQAGNDFAVFIAAPGRTLGRAPKDLNGKEGAADQIGDLFEVTSDIAGGADASIFPSGSTTAVPTIQWSGNGSWEVHNYKKAANGSYCVLDKYGKMGLRCVHPT